MCEVGKEKHERSQNINGRMAGSTSTVISWYIVNGKRESIRVLICFLSSVITTNLLCVNEYLFLLNLKGGPTGTGWSWNTSLYK